MFYSVPQCPNPLGPQRVGCLDLESGRHKLIILSFISQVVPHCPPQNSFFSNRDTCGLQGVASAPGMSGRGRCCRSRLQLHLWTMERCGIVCCSLHMAPSQSWASAGGPELHFPLPVCVPMVSRTKQPLFNIMQRNSLYKGIQPLEALRPTGHGILCHVLQTLRVIIRQ